MHGDEIDALHPALTSQHIHLTALHPCHPAFPLYTTEFQTCVIRSALYLIAHAARVVHFPR